MACYLVWGYFVPSGEGIVYIEYVYIFICYAVS